MITKFFHILYNFPTLVKKPGFILSKVKSISGKIKLARVVYNPANNYNY